MSADIYHEGNIMKPSSTFTPPPRPLARLAILAATLAVMVLTATQVQAQIINSSIWLEGKGRRVLWGCGQNYETTLHIKSSGGSASVTLRLRTVVSGAGTAMAASPAARMAKAIL